MATGSIKSYRTSRNLREIGAAAVSLRNLSKQHKEVVPASWIFCLHVCCR